MTDSEKLCETCGNPIQDVSFPCGQKPGTIYEHRDERIRKACKRMRKKEG